MKTKDGRTPGQVTREAFCAAEPSLTLADMWEAAAQAVLDAFRDQIEREGAVKALRLLTEQCPGDWAGIGLCAMRQSAKQIKEKIESGEVNL